MVRVGDFTAVDAVDVVWAVRSLHRRAEIDLRVRRYLAGVERSNQGDRLKVEPGVYSDWVARFRKGARHWGESPHCSRLLT